MTDKSRLRHPLHAAEHEVEHLHDIATRGESAATPAILVATWIAIVLPLIAIVVGVAFGVAYLVTGSAGTSYPAAPAGGTTGTGTAASGRMNQVTFGGKVMPSFESRLDEQQIREVASYVSTVVAKGRS